MNNKKLSRRDVLVGAGTAAAALALPGTSVLAQVAPSSFLRTWDFANKSVGTLLSYGGAKDVGKISMLDPSWIDNVANHANQEVNYAQGTQGFVYPATWVANQSLISGVPAVDLVNYVGGVTSPNTEYYRGKASGPYSRATGVIIDGNGAVGGYINGWDTPSEKTDDRSAWKSYGPDIHFLKEGFSPPIFGNNQRVRCGVLVKLGQSFFTPAAGVDGVGVGGQLGWRIDFQRDDYQPFRPGLDASGKPLMKISVLLGFWDSRNVGDPGFDGNDFVGGFTAGESWLAGTLVAGKTSQFVTNYGANMLTGRQQFRQARFDWDITRDNMLNILSAFGAAGYTTPEMLRITGAGFNAELYDNRPANQLGEFKPGQFGFSYSDFGIVAW